MLTDRLQQDNYVFTDGDLSLINEMQAPKQEMNIEERPNFESPDMPDSFAADPGDEENENLVSAAVEETADFIVDAIDLGASFGLHMISKAPIEEHQASDEQKSKIRQIVYVYCKETGGYIPLWLQFLLLIVGIYGMQIPTALSMRKINELEEQNKKLQEEIQKLNLQKESKRLKEELKEVENAESAK